MHSLPSRPVLPVLVGALALAFSTGTAAERPSEGVPRLVQVGPMTGDAEKDTVAFEMAGQTGCSGLVPRFADQPMQLGPAGGDPEKENFGLMVIDHEDCNAAASRR